MDHLNTAEKNSCKLSKDKKENEDIDLLKTNNSIF